MEIWLHYIRENVLVEIVDLFYIPTQDQVAEILTKALEKRRFTKLRTELGIPAVDLLTEN